MLTVQELVARITLDDSDYKRGMDNVEKSGGKMKANVTKAALGVGAALAVAGGFAIKSASDLGEQVSKTGVVFGDNAKEVHQWSKGLAGDFGLSQRAALEAAGTYGNMLKPMGVAPKLTKEISTNFVELAGDMASFNNASPEETLDALRAGLSGETEPLRKFGVFLSEATIKAEALAMGLVKPVKNMGDIHYQQLKVKESLKDMAAAMKEHGKGSDEYALATAKMEREEGRLQKMMEGKVPQLTAAQKAQASYGVIMKSTADAQGDFARTADSLPNSMRTLKADTENLAAGFGQMLLPAAVQVTGAAKDLMHWMTENQGVVKVLVGVVGGLTAAWLLYVVGAKAVTFATNAIKVAKGAATAATWLYTGAQQALNLAMSMNPIGLVVIALVALGVGLVVAYKKSETFRDIVTGAFEAIKDVAEDVMGFFTKTIPDGFNKVLSWVKGHWPEIATIIAGPFAPIVALATDSFGVRTALVNAFTAIKSFVGEKISDVAGFITGLPGRVKDFGATLLSTFTGFFTGAGIGAWVSARIADWAGFITGIPGKIKDFGATLLSTFTGFFAGAGIGGWVGDRVLDWANFVTGIPGRIADFGATLLEKVMGIINGAGIGKAIVERLQGWADFFGDLPSKAATAISNKAKDLWEAVTDIFSGLPGFVKKILGISSPSKVFADIGHDVVRGIVKGLKDKAGDLRRQAIDMAKGLAGDAWDALSGVASGAAGAVGSAVGAVGGAIGFGGSDKPEGNGGTAGFVSGDIAGLATGLMTALRDMSGATGRAIYVQSGFRSHAEQAALVAQKGIWDPVTNPTGAAPVGTSKHESGNAADITPGREFFGWIASRFGLSFPIPKEPWHVEKYDIGGILKPGWTMAYNGTGENEYVRRSAGGGGGPTINIYAGAIIPEREIMAIVEKGQATLKRTRPNYGSLKPVLTG